jgi:hypothetical protein
MDLCMYMLLKIIFSCMSYNKDRKGIYIFLLLQIIPLRLWSLHLKCTHWGIKRWKFFCFPFLTSFSLKKYIILLKKVCTEEAESYWFSPLLLLAFILKFNTHKNALKFRVGMLVWVVCKKSIFKRYFLYL